MSDDQRVRLGLGGRVVLGLMIVSAAIILYRFGLNIAEGVAHEPALWAGWYVGVVLIALVSAGISVLAAWLVSRGMRAAPILVTVVGVWDASTILSWGDVLSWFSAALSVVAIVTVWLPSTRSNAAAIRVARRRRKERSLQPRSFSAR